MFLLRWIPTFLAFPLAGVVVTLTVGPERSALTALAAGAVLGGIVGLAQWLALGRSVDWRWAVGTLAAVAGGAVVSMFAVGPPLGVVPALVTGLITGTAAGAVQATLLGRRLRTGLIWTATVGVSWAGGWLLTSAVLIDIDRSHAVFGSNGAIAMTLVTGIVVRLILGPRPWRMPQDTASARTIGAAASVIAATTAARRTDRD